MISYKSKEAQKIFLEASKNLDEYVCSAETMSEQTYSDFYKDKENPMVFVQHHPLCGGFDVYRSRMGDSIEADEDITNPSTFSYVPNKKCTSSRPPLQRCNFSGQSVFYASMSLKTNFKEIDPKNCAGKEVYISKWHVDEDANANMFRIIPPEGIDMEEDYKGYLKIDKDIEYPRYTTEYLRKIGNIFTNNRGSEKEKYLPCALISNFIYEFCYTEKPLFPGQSSRYDGILYPSVKDQDRSLLNVVFTQRFIDQHVRLKHVVKGIIDNDLMSIRMLEIGFFNGKEIVWYFPTTLKNSIRINRYLYYNDKNEVCDTTKGQLFDKSHRKVKDYHIGFWANIDIWMKQLTEIPIAMGNFNDIEDTSSFIKTVDDWCIIRELTGWTLESEEGTINITKVLYEFEYKVTLERIESKKK